MKTIEWSPHPLKRPGFYLVGLLHIAVGALLLRDALTHGTLLAHPWLGPTIAFAVALLVGATLFLPAGARKGPGRIAVFLFVALMGLALHLALGPGRGDRIHPGLPFGIVLGLTGVFLFFIAEWRRRLVRIVLDQKEVSVFVRPWRLEHTLPLDAVKDVSAARTFGGRLFGYGDFVARVRKGTMSDRITKPLVGESPPPDAARGNGWDEEERFHIVAAHPYKGLRRQLENRILLAKMPPKDREEAELADRLAEDLGDVRV